MIHLCVCNALYLQWLLYIFQMQTHAIHHWNCTAAYCNFSWGNWWMFSVSHCSKTEIFIFPEGKRMIPNGCINFNAEIQFKEDFIGVQFPENILSLLSFSIYIYTYIFFSNWDSQSPFLWLSFINLFLQITKKHSSAEATWKAHHTIQMYSRTWETKRRYWRQRHIRR